MKKMLSGLLCFAMLFSMVACSSTTETSGNLESQPGEMETSQTGQNGDTITVTDMKGTVEIPANPQRIVDTSGSADELIILEMPFVGSANTSMFDPTIVPEYLQEYFAENNVETVGNYSGSAGDLDLEKIAELEPDLIIMNIRHDNVYDQMCEIAPTVMLDDDISYVNWRGRFQQLGEWFGKEDVVEEWLANYDAQAAEYADQLKAVTRYLRVAVIEDNSVRSGTYYVYSTGGPGELIYDALGLPASSGVPENVWGAEVDAEYFFQIDADHVLYFSDDGTVGDTADLPTWKNMKAVQNGNVYCGINEQQYDLAYTPNGKLIYMERIVNAILNHQNIDE